MKTSRDRRHTAIRKYKNKLIGKFVNEGIDKHLFPNSFPCEYFDSLVRDYKRVGIKITLIENTQQGKLFKMEVM